MKVAMQFGNSGGSNAPIVTETLSPTVTKTSGNTSIDSAEAVRYGNVIHFNFNFLFTGTTNAGNNAFVGTVTGIPLPAIPQNGAGFFSNSALIGALDSDGIMTIRVVGGNRSSSQTVASVRFIYICN